MNYKSLSTLAVVLIANFNLFGQDAKAIPTPTRNRIISTESAAPATAANVQPSPTPNRVVVTDSLPAAKATPIAPPISSPSQMPSATRDAITQGISSSSEISPGYVAPPKAMTFGQIRSRIAEAKRLMQTRPIPTSMTESFLPTELVRIAFYDWKKNQIDFVVTTKDSFLTTGLQLQTSSANGNPVYLRIIRANGVNTPVILADQFGSPHTPLIVQYPVERGGYFNELAYYTSTHPGVVNPEVVGAGRLYVRNTIDAARERLRAKGIFIAPEITDVAERLVTVEHVDHSRFKNEFRPNLYNEIFTLYALNEGSTYRYAVSSAGAGGMVQMIPSTYYMIRSRFYGVGLVPDFVEGMRNHLNAAQAMLLYMQMTWDDLAGNETIINALDSGIASQWELIAAGYNSNPSNLPAYIRRGGMAWRLRIPKETRMYLQIYGDFERNVLIEPRKQ